MTTMHAQDCAREPAEGAVGLSKVVQRCIVRARAEGSALLRVCFDIAALDPWRIWGAQAPTGESGMAWHDLETGMCFSACGMADEVETQGPDRVSAALAPVVAVSRQVTTVDEHGGTLRPDGLPLWLGGFAFSPRAVPSDTTWRGWPRGWLFVPRVLCIGDGRGGARLVVSQRISSQSTVGAVLSQLERERRAALAASAATVAPVDAPAASNREALLPVDEHGPWEMWRDDVVAASAAIEADALNKVVLARTAVMAVDTVGSAMPRALSRLRDASTDGVVFAIRRRDGSAFVGATPETLVRLRGERVTTAAIAGTAPRFVDDHRDRVAAQELAESAKEHQEHVLVSQAMSAALGGFCRELHVDPSPRVHKFSLVQHLETRMHGVLAGSHHVLELVHALHPTPAVAGWPAREAVSWLAEHERFDRGWYAGPIGWVTADGSGHFAVALRCAHVRDGGARLYAGAGITGSSLPEGEWEETALKLRTMATALQSPLAPR